MILIHNDNRGETGDLIMFVCICRGVRERHIREAVRDGDVCFDDVQDRLEVGICCGMCKETAEEIISETLSETHKERRTAPHTNTDSLFHHA